MTISISEVEQIARLARLELADAELTEMSRSLASILRHIHDLDSADVEDLSPMGSASQHTAPMREDTPGADTLHLTLSEIAPAFEEDFFTVPRLAALDTEALDGGSA